MPKCKTDIKCKTDTGAAETKCRGRERESIKNKRIQRWKPDNKRLSIIYSLKCSDLGT